MVASLSRFCESIPVCSRLYFYYYKHTRLKSDGKIKNCQLLPMRIEVATPGLQDPCSAAELWRLCKIINQLPAGATMQLLCLCSLNNGTLNYHLKALMAPVWCFLNIFILTSHSFHIKLTWIATYYLEIYLWKEKVQQIAVTMFLLKVYC